MSTYTEDQKTSLLALAGFQAFVWQSDTRRLYPRVVHPAGATLARRLDPQAWQANRANKMIWEFWAKSKFKNGSTSTSNYRPAQWEDVQIDTIPDKIFDEVMTWAQKR